MNDKQTLLTALRLRFMIVFIRSFDGTTVGRIYSSTTSILVGFLMLLGLTLPRLYLIIFAWYLLY